MNVLVLMAGGDAAFHEAGYIYPKNLIEINGKPIVQHVVESLTNFGDRNVNYIFLIRKEEAEKSYTGRVIKLLVPDAEIVPLPGTTSGAACTALWAIDHINSDEPLLITNGDQVLDVSYKEVLDSFESRQLDGGIPVFEAVHPRWSYVKVDDQGSVIETAEKRPISKLATAGTYYFKRGADFVQSVKDMIFKDARVDGIFYVCPAYNEMVLRLKRIGIFHMEANHYHQIKNPRGLSNYEHYLEHKGI